MLALCAVQDASARNYDFVLIAAPPAILELSTASASMNQQGVVAFIAFTDATTRGVFSGSGSALAPIASEDGVAIGFLSGRTSINGDGVVVFQGTTPGFVTTIWSGSGGPVATLYDTSHTFSDLLDPQINDAGQVAFRADYAAGGRAILLGDGSGHAPATIANEMALPSLGRISDLNASGVTAFLADGSSFGTRLVVRGGVGSVDTITEAGELGDTLGTVDGDVTLNDAGVVACAGSFGPAGHEKKGVFTGSGGPLSPVADSTGVYATLQHPRINNSGEVAFQADLDLGAGAGIFTGADPVANKVIQSGDALFGSTVAQVELSGFNDAGQVAFEAQLADGRSVVARADPVPEPQAPLASALALGSLAALRSRRTGPRLRVRGGSLASFSEGNDMPRKVQTRSRPRKEPKRIGRAGPQAGQVRRRPSHISSPSCSICRPLGRVSNCSKACRTNRSSKRPRPGGEPLDEIGDPPRVPAHGTGSILSSNWARLVSGMRGCRQISTGNDITMSEYSSLSSRNASSGRSSSGNFSR